MYAVFRTGGKQYRVAKGDIIRFEKIDAEEGALINFEDVLLIGDGADIKVGNPLLSDSFISAKILRQGKSKKVSVVKFKRRHNYLRQGTHRQFFTEVEITAINAKGLKETSSKLVASKAKKTATKKAATKKTETKKAVTKKTVNKKTAAKKTVTKKTAAKKTATKKTATKKTATKKTATKKTVSKKSK